MQMLAERYGVGDNFAYTIQTVEEDGCQEVAADLDPTLTITGKIKQKDGTYINLTITADPDQDLNKGILQVLSDSPLTTVGLAQVQFIFNYATVPPLSTSDGIMGFYVEERL